MIEYIYYLSYSYVLFCMLHSSVFLAELKIHVHHCLIKCGGVLHQQNEKKMLLCQNLSDDSTRVHM